MVFGNKGQPCGNGGTLVSDEHATATQADS